MNIFKRLLLWLYPPRCVFCHRILEKEDIVCECCSAELPYRPNKKRIETLPHIDACITPFYYEDTVRDAVLRYKFRGVRGNAEIFARMMLECYQQELFGKTDLITWVPISRLRLRKRGYDQAEQLAKALCSLVGRTPTKTLIKIRNNKPQSKQKTAAGRRANVIGAYRLANTSVYGKSVLLIDDVITSGSTVSECAHVLRAAGAKKVYVLAFARTPNLQKKIESYQKSGIMVVKK